MPNHKPQVTNSNFKIPISKKNGAGFTLIELIVAFSVMAILSVIGIASFVDYSRSQAILADRQKIITVLNTAKANASSQVKNSYCLNSPYPSLNKVLNGYEVIINSDGSYTLNIQCVKTDTRVTNDINLPPTYTLSNNITFDTSTNVAKIFFPLFTGKAVLTDQYGNTPSDPAQIVLTGYNKTKRTIITIDQTGLIK